MKLTTLPLFLIGFLLVCLTSCSSMTPLQVNSTLPTLTKTKMLSNVNAQKAIAANQCNILVKGRKYTAPIALSVKGDLKNGAIGIDEWVEVDGGNSYILRNYQWNTVDHQGTTELSLEFDTLHCK